MITPNTKKAGSTPFENTEDYLRSLYILMDLLIFADADARMEKYGLPAGQDAGSWAKLAADRLAASAEAGIPIPAELVLTRSGAPSYLRMCLIYLLRIALEPDYEQAAAKERGKDSLDLADLIGLFAPQEEELSAADIFAAVENARDSLELLFPQLKGRDMISRLTPVMDQRLAALLTGGSQDRLPFGMEYLGDPDPENKTDTENQNIQKLSELLKKREELMAPEIVVLWGPEGSGKKSVLREFACDTGRFAVRLSLADASAEPAASGQLPYPGVAMLIRECVLTGSIPVLTKPEKLTKEQAAELMEMLRADGLSRFQAVYLLADTDEMPDYLSDAVYLAMPGIRTVDRIRIWESLPGIGELPEESVEALANTFSLTPGQIRHCAAQALRLAGPEGKITEDQLYRVCYTLLGHPLKAHTNRMQSPYVWDDLKMNPADKAVLRDLTRSVRNRHIVMQEWGFEKKVPYGNGITVLFSGPPGTGKTMAAQVIANELHMELYRIDVSQLIDKYVGETEKNIRRVFEQAKKSNSVLFFDEADAIFNKRLEAKNSNERFANIESSLLLQCIEEYSGVAILATNNMAAIDAAFIRRFRFYITFKEPDEKIRLEIWNSVFPKEAPLDSEVSLPELAHIFKFNGSIIKNVALQAAYLAAEHKKPIGYLEILVAVRRELEKNQVVLSQEKMGSLGSYFPEVMSWNGDL